MSAITRKDARARRHKYILMRRSSARETFTAGCADALRVLYRSLHSGTALGPVEAYSKGLQGILGMLSVLIASRRCPSGTDAITGARNGDGVCFQGGYGRIR